MQDVLAMHSFSRSPRHVLVDDAESADLIVLAGHINSCDEARRNELLRRYPNKTMLYTEYDFALPYAPGIYASASRSRWIDLRRTRSFMYFSRHFLSLNESVCHRPNEKKDLLFCFRGRRDCRVRGNLMDHDFGRPDVLVVDTSDYEHWGEGPLDRRQAQREYVDTLARSHFALCPRGYGFGSIRLFEVMEIGVPPVLLSDWYALPKGPDWESFLIRVKEKDYARLPEILEAHVSESAERGRLARAAWERFFSPEVAFDRMIDQMEEILQDSRMPQSVYRLWWRGLEQRHKLRTEASVMARRVIAAARRLGGGKGRPRGWVRSDPR